jgi:hypothetical protein
MWYPFIEKSRKYESYHYRMNLKISASVIDMVQYCMLVSRRASQQISLAPLWLICFKLVYNTEMQLGSQEHMLMQAET